MATDSKDYGAFNPENDTHLNLPSLIYEILYDKETELPTKKIADEVENHLAGKEGYDQPDWALEVSWGSQSIRYNYVPNALKWMSDTDSQYNKLKKDSRYDDNQRGGKETDFYTVER